MAQSLGKYFILYTKISNYVIVMGIINCERTYDIHYNQLYRYIQFYSINFIADR